MSLYIKIETTALTYSSLHETNRHHAVLYILFITAFCQIQRGARLRSDIQLIYFVLLHPEFQVLHGIYVDQLHYLVRINNTIPFCILPVTQRCNTIIIVIIILYYNSDEWGWRISQRSLTHPRVSQSSRAANSTHHCAVNEFSLNHHKGKFFSYKHECMHAFKSSCDAAYMWL